MPELSSTSGRRAAVEVGVEAGVGGEHPGGERVVLPQLSVGVVGEVRVLS